MKWEEFVAIAKQLPEVEESTSYGRPSLKVRGKYMAGFNTDEKAFVLRLANVEEQDFLIEAEKHAASAAQIPSAGCPSAVMAAESCLFSTPANTMTAASRVSLSVTRKPPTNLLSMPMRFSVAVKMRPPP